MKKSHFSIAVEGKSMLMGPFFSYGFQEFPHAVWYDRSDFSNAARGFEVALSEKGLTREQDRAMAKRAAKSLAKPKKTTVTAAFTEQGYDNRIVITGRRREQVLTINTAELTLEKFESAMARLIDALKRVL